MGGAGVGELDAVGEGGGGLREGRPRVLLDEVRVDLDHEGLAGVLHRLVGVFLRALHQRHGGPARQVGRGGQGGREGGLRAVVLELVEEDVFPQKQVFNYLNANFLNFRADFDAPNGKTLSAIYEVKGLPTLIFLDPNGVVLERKLGAVGYSDIKKMGDAALAKMKK